MKRCIQILLAAALIAKLSLGGHLLFKWHAWPEAGKGEAVASESAPRAAASANGEKIVQPPPPDLALLREQQAELERKKSDLAAQRADLEKLRATLDEKIEALRRLRDDIRARQEQKQLLQEAKLKHLIKVYSAMKPQNAAGLIENMDTRFAVELFSKMKGEAVGDILSHVKVEKATAISEGLLRPQ